MKIIKDIVGLLLALALAALLVAGYLHNVYQVAVFSGSFGMELLRAVGVIIPPLGALLGFL